MFPKCKICKEFRPIKSNIMSSDKAIHTTRLRYDPNIWVSDKELKIAMINMLKDLTEKSTIYMNKWVIPAERWKTYDRMKQK